MHEARVGLPVLEDIAEEDGAQALGLLEGGGGKGGWMVIVVVIYRGERKHIPTAD